LLTEACLLETGNRELCLADGLAALPAALAAALGLLAGLTFLFLVFLFPLILSPKKPDGYIRLCKCIPR
jgi:hypothetical protein